YAWFADALSSADTRWGTRPLRAIIGAIADWPTSPVPAAAAGGRAFIMLPFGATTEIARKTPPLIAPCGSSAAFTPMKAYPFAKASVMFAGPSDWADVPV